MRPRDRIVLWIVGLAVPATAAAVLLFAAHGAHLSKAARDCRRALELGLPRPPDCDRPEAPPAPAVEPSASPLPADLPCYERRGGGPLPEAAEGGEEGEGPRPGTEYVVREGDTFLAIVRAAYGSIERWPEVWFENADRVREGTFLRPGTRLRLPE